MAARFQPASTAPRANTRRKAARAPFRRTVPERSLDSLTPVVTTANAAFVTPSRKLTALRQRREIHSDFKDVQQSSLPGTVTRAKQSMKDAPDHLTFDLLVDNAAAPSSRTTKPRLGRAKMPDALSDAERAQRYRARKKTRLAEMRQCCSVRPSSTSLRVIPGSASKAAIAASGLSPASATLLMPF